MSMIAFQRPDLFRFSHHGFMNRYPTHRVSVSTTMKINPSTPQPLRIEGSSVKLQTLEIPESNTLKPPNPLFNRHQNHDQEYDHKKKMEFEQFVAREAKIDEEYWIAARLRAESHWEDQPNDRYIDSYKRKFMEQEYNGLKRRCTGQPIQNCICIVAVKKEEKNVKHKILKSIVGTLDLSIQHLLNGQTFPGEYVKVPIFSRISITTSCEYGYISNLCVAKLARRQGIARKMLHFSIESAKLNGLEQVFVHVHRDNKPAEELYRKMGFQIVEMATPLLSEEQNYLLCLKI